MARCSSAIARTANCTLAGSNGMPSIPSAISARARALELDEAATRVREPLGPRVEQLRLAHAESRALVCRQVDAAESRVRANVSQNVDELHGVSKRDGRRARGGELRVGHAQQRERHLADDAGDAVAVPLEIVPSLVAHVRLGVRLHPVEHRLEERRRERRVFVDGLKQQAVEVVARFAGVHLAQRGAAVAKRGEHLLGRAALGAVDDLVGAPAPGVERHKRAARLRVEEV